LIWAKDMELKVQNVNEIDYKKVFESTPEFNKIDDILEEQRYSSLKYLENALFDENIGLN